MSSCKVLSWLPNKEFPLGISFGATSQNAGQVVDCFESKGSAAEDSDAAEFASRPFVFQLFVW